MLKNDKIIVYKIVLRSFVFIMRKENEIDFISLLLDETFLKLVKESNGVDNQLDVLEREFPGKKEEIAHAVVFLKIHLSHQKRMQSKEVTRILQNIRAYSGNGARTVTIRYNIYKIWKIAAAIILLFVSSVVAYQWLTNKDTLEQIAAIQAMIDDEAMIILSDGSKHKLGINEAQIQYSHDGGEVVVKKDALEEKIENNKTAKSATINQIIVPFGRRHGITLSDGTRVQLNSGSRLVFPAEFSDSKREVYLKGEGYFEVSKNIEKPFMVRTDFVNIKVLGTEFNISAYDDEQVATTVLVEGKVVVSQKNKRLGFTEKNLEPGQGCFYSSSTFTSEIKEVHLFEYTSWKDGLFYFTDKPLNNVVSRVEKYYNQKIHIDGEILPHTLISGKLVLSENIDEVMQYLVKTLETRYDKREDGTYLIKNGNN